MGFAGDAVAIAVHLGAVTWRSAIDRRSPGSPGIITPSEIATALDRGDFLWRARP